MKRKLIVFGATAMALLSSISNLHAQIISGVVKSDIDVVIGADKSGQVKSANLRVGKFIKKGDVLITYVCNSEKARVDVYRAKLQLAEQELSQQESLLADNTIPRNDVLISRSREKIARAELSEQMHAVKACTARSPVSGYIAQVAAKVGQYLKQGEPIVHLIDNSKLYGEANVSKEHWHAVKDAGLATLVFKGAGKDSEIARSATIQHKTRHIGTKGSFTVRLVLQDTQELTSGMFFDLQLIQPKPIALVQN